ncbi:MAG: hypothetical protein V7603_4368 [Micromonosporaceae bacterium]
MIGLWRRRRYQVVAAVCGAAVLATGVLVADHVWFGGVAALLGSRTNGGADAGTSSVSPGGPAGTMARGLGLGGASPAASGRGAAPGATSTATNGTHGKPGKPDKPAEPTTTRTVTIDGVSATITESGSMPTLHHTMRVVSARADLWRQRELAWVADAGHKVGDATCTQNFRFNPTGAARVRSTLLLCWHTSATKSVYTVVVDVDHRPSEHDSVAIIDQTWSKLG